MRRLKMPKLSVIIPVYNTEKYVRRCLDSVLKNQGWKDLEVIVVDDCSPGNIAEIVAEYQESYSNLKFLRHETNKGLFRARITGLQAFTGDYFTFIDSDDWAGVDLYRALMEAAISEKADIVTADRLEVMESDGSYYAPHDMLAQRDWDLRGKEILDHLMEQRGLDYGWWVVWNKIYARSIWEKSHALLEAVDQHLIMCEDIAFSTAFFCCAEHLFSTHYYYYYYYRSNESSTIKKATFSKYKKNLQDIKLSFSIAKKALCQVDCFEEKRYDLEQWQNFIVQGWQSRLKQDETLNAHEKNELEKYIVELLSNPEQEPSNLDCTFCASGCNKRENHLETIRKAIIDEKTKVVSFDCFDTLVVRPFLAPVDLFHLLDVYINQEFPSIDFCVFTNIRITAEQRARERKHLTSPSWEDVTLAEIYAEVTELCPAMVPYLEKIKAKEIELEIRYCNTRETGKELLKCALAHGKRVICTSDMYLPVEVIRDILHKNGYDEIQKIYLSCEVGLTKSTGQLYRYVLKEENLIKLPEAIVHIGDNWNSDVEKAQCYGIRSYHLPKTADLFRNENPGIYTGGSYYPIFCAQNGINYGFSITEYWGMRCMMAVVANKLFDNPFVFYRQETDFNIDSYTIGYYLLGMYTFSLADWLQKETQETSYDNLCFMARDGYLMYHAFKMLNNVYHNNVELHYTHLSRKAILPLMITKEADFYAMYNNFTLGTLTPRSFLKIATPIVNQEKMEKACETVEAQQIPYNKPFQNIESFMKFGKLFFKEFFDEGATKRYRENFKKYFDQQFNGKSATFDVGYSARCESVLKENFNYDITAYYVHINNDRPLGRMQRSDVTVKTMYPTTPFITGFIREQLMSELAPSCLEYREQDGVFGPYFEELHLNLQTRFVTKTMQNAALDFVHDMVQIFGDDLQYLAYRPYDACMPLEYYFSESKEADRTLFKGTLFEDDMGMGKNINMFDLWQRELHRWGGTANNANISSVNGIDYTKYPRFTRVCLMLLTDWGTAKQKCREKLGSKHPHLLKGLIVTYHGVRKCYRAVTGKNK